VTNPTEPSQEASIGGTDLGSRDPELSSRFDRQRSLCAAWRVLGELEMVSDDHHLMATMAAIGGELEEIPPTQLDATHLDKIDAAHDAVETEMRVFAAEVSSSALHRTLPRLVQDERPAVIDFLDLMLALEEDGRDRSATRAETTGFVISLLCTDGPRVQGALDPISLSSRLLHLCERAHEEAPPGLDQVASALLAVRDRLDLGSSEVDEPKVDQKYRREIGQHFFVPDILRAFVAYRSTQLTRAFPYHASTRMISVSGAPGAATTELLASPFETEVIPQLAEAVQRRMAGEPQEHSAIDRIAWCLDLEFLNHVERRALGSNAIGTRDDLPGTTILVGLLCRSAEVLADELEPIGISFDRLTEDWVKELNEAVKKQSDQLLVDDYKKACALSELRNRFLFDALAQADSDPRVNAPVRAAVRDEEADAERAFRREARELASRAISNPRPSARASAKHEHEAGAGGWWRGLPPATRSKLGFAAVVFTLLVGTVAFTFWPSGEMQSLDREWLSRVSPHLVEGSRNGAGQGETFVGELNAGWRSLSPDEQQDSAITVVERLQASGVRNVMVYDELGELRIQAFGEAAARVVLGD